MHRFILCLLALFVMSSASAGVYEEALKQNERVFIYIYTQNCGYCVKFKPIYEKLAVKYAPKCKFVKIDADTEYGKNLARAFGVRFVPYVVLANSKMGQTALMPPNCLLHFECADDIMRGFVK